VDNFVLYNPDGATYINLGSFLRIADEPVDVGNANLQTPFAFESPGVGGGVFGGGAGLRRMSLPLMLGSNAAWGGLSNIESMVRYFARKGAWLDIQTFGVPSAEAIRFDIEFGVWEPRYETRVGELARRRGDLKLITQPYGYWPTWILIASAPSAVATMAQNWSSLFVGGSWIGDGPKEMRISLGNKATQFALPSPGAGGTLDRTFLWSLTTRPSWNIAFTGTIPNRLEVATYLNPVMSGVNAGERGYFSDPTTMPYFNSTGVYCNVTGSWIIGQGATTWGGLFVAHPSMYGNIGSHSLFYGKFRALALMRNKATNNSVALNIMGDTDVSFTGNWAPLATVTSPVATLAPWQSTCNNISANEIVGGGWQVLDLGIHDFGGWASYYNNSVTGHPWFRIWGRPIVGSPVASLGPSYRLEFGGLLTLPIDDEFVNNGAVLGGVDQTGAFTIEAGTDTAWTANTSRWSETQGMQENLMPVYTGAFPVVDNPSVSALHMIWYQGWSGYLPTGPAVINQKSQRQLSAWYRPRFAFVKGL